MAARQAATRWAWGKYLQDDIEPRFNTICALTDFTAKNGAARVVPDSSDWPDDREPRPEAVRQAVMPAGSVPLYKEALINSPTILRCASLT